MEDTSDTGIATCLYLSPPLIYGVSEEQLQLLERSGGKYWKDLLFMSLPLCIALLLNGYGLTGDPRAYDFAKINSPLKINIILNYLFGIFFLAVAFISGVAWFFTGNEFKKTMKSIRTEKIKYMVTTSANAETITLTPQPPQK